MEWFFVFLLLVVASMAYAAVSAAPWVPTRKGDITRFLSLIDVRPGMKLYELGCGDGRLVMRAVKERGVAGVGIELSLAQVIVAYIRKLATGSPARILWKNLFRVNLSDADIVYLFLMPRAYEKIRSKLET